MIKRRRKDQVLYGLYAGINDLLLHPCGAIFVILPRLQVTPQAKMYFCIIHYVSGAS